MSRSNNRPRSSRSRQGVRRQRPRRWALALAPIALLAGGCVEQDLSIDSNPPGAVVYLNDQEVGRTPFTTEFRFYGWYDVAVRKNGYVTLKTESAVIAPWWQFIPFDFISALLPIRLTDAHHLHYTLRPTTPGIADPEGLVRRGENLRSQLETGIELPSTHPAKKPRPSSSSNAFKSKPPHPVLPTKAPAAPGSALPATEPAIPAAGPALPATEPGLPATEPAATLPAPAASEPTTSASSRP